MYKSIVLSLFFLYIQSTTYCQYSVNKESVSILFSSLSQHIGSLKLFDPQQGYRYDALTVDLEYAREIGTKSSASKRKWRSYYLIQSHLGTSTYKFRNRDIEFRRGREVGVNAGLKFGRTLLNNLFESYIGGTVGLYHVSGLPERQHSGFIFSDVVFGGVIIKFTDKVSLDSRFSLRHLSNASLAKPNGGVNNLTSSLGVVFTL